jgi:hypothetical protein
MARKRDAGGMGPKARDSESVVSRRQLDNREAQLQADRRPATVAVKQTGNVYGGLGLEVEGVEKWWSLTYRLAACQT